MIHVCLPLAELVVVKNVKPLHGRGPSRDDTNLMSEVGGSVLTLVF